MTLFSYINYFLILKGWKNSIRHNLSLHDIFVREISSGSKASYWTLRDDLNVRPLTLENMVCFYVDFIYFKRYLSMLMMIKLNKINLHKSKIITPDKI